MAQRWPVLKSYPMSHLSRIALPIGGIGTGTVSLGGRGDLRDWEVVNHTAKGFVPEHAFFVLRAQSDRKGAKPVLRVVEGPLDDSQYEGTSGSPAPLAGMPRFSEASFDAAYPLGQVYLSDPEMPLRVRLEAFNPLVPGDADSSGIPVAVLRYVLVNPGRTAVRATLCGSLKNFIGRDGLPGEPGVKGNRNEYRQSRGVRGIFMQSDGVDPKAEQWGTLVLATTSRGALTYRTAWVKDSWRHEALAEFWRDLADDGRLEARQGEGPESQTASLAVNAVVPPKGEVAITFLLAWHFPNRRRWVWPTEPVNVAREIVGNYYATQYRDAWDVLEKTTPRLGKLEEQTLAFTRSVVESDLPEPIQEAALFNLTALRSQVSFRTADGRFFGWEGGHNARVQWNVLGTATHVWCYEQATAFLFGDLARSMRDTNFAHMTDSDGALHCRCRLPIERACEEPLVAADGQAASILLFYRDWQLSGDHAFLQRHWPAIRRAMEFCWRPGSWDADADGVMEGCQHNTLDTEYFGPNPVMAGWYLAALKACSAMADASGDQSFAQRCRDLFKRGRAWVDEHLFNSQYYQQQIRRDFTREQIDPRLQSAAVGEMDLANPPYQLGRGCLVDQLVGILVGRISGLDDLLETDHVRTTLQSIHRRNFRRHLHSHANHMRSFALGDEPATLMCSYDEGAAPEVPFPYYTEVMTGFEYAPAVHMLYEGMESEALELIAATRSRYDGRRRSPFDEAEWGHHYARAMIAWGAVVAYVGFHYSAVTQTLTFAPRNGTWFWSNGYAWGTVQIKKTARQTRLQFTVLYGELKLRRLKLRGGQEQELPRPTTLKTGKSATWAVPSQR